MRNIQAEILNLDKYVKGIAKEFVMVQNNEVLRARKRLEEEKAEALGSVMEYVHFCVKNKTTDTASFQYFLKIHGGKEKVREQYLKWLESKHPHPQELK